MGVASGDVTADTAMLWTRYGGGLPLSCVVWEMAQDTYVRIAGQVSPVVVADGGYVHVEVQNLTPSTRYRYAFFEHGANGPVARSPIGRFRAALAPDSQAPIVLGAVSCVKLGHSFATLERAAERNDLDAFVLLGDTSYNDGARTLLQFRDKWLASFRTQPWKSLRQSTSVFATWDDHELGNDWDEAEDAAVISAATRSWFENLPIRRHGLSLDRIYRSTRWGRTAELFALDCKTERRRSEKKYLSTEQLEWLKTGLANSPATFKVILNSVPIGTFPFPFTLVDRHRWTGFPEQRNEILSFIEEQKIQGVLWLSGDFHLGSVGRVSASGVGSTALEVLAGPGAQNSNLAVSRVNGPQFDFATGTNNYVALHLEPSTRECRVVFHDGSGATLWEQAYVL